LLKFWNIAPPPSAENFDETGRTVNIVAYRLTEALLDGNLTHNVSR